MWLVSNLPKIHIRFHLLDSFLDTVQYHLTTETTAHSEPTATSWLGHLQPVKSPVIDHSTSAQC